MKLRSLSPLAAAAGICIAGSAVAQEPARTSAMPAKTTTTARVSSNPVANQQLADTVATRLTTSGAAQMADVSISVVDGIVTLTGTAKDSATKELVINQVRQVAGVKKVRDGINTTSSIMLAQGVGPLAAPASVGVPPGGIMPNIEPSALGAKWLCAKMSRVPLAPVAASKTSTAMRRPSGEMATLVTPRRLTP